MRRLTCFGISLICFICCILIVKLFSGNHLIRGFIGDVVVIVLIYFFFKGFYNFNPAKLTALTLILAFAIEFLQYLKLVKTLGLEENMLAVLILGSVFDPMDLLAYTMGAIITYILDTKLISPCFQN